MSPPAAFQARPRLWRALEQAFPVRFVARELDRPGDVDAIVAYGVRPPVGSAAATLCAEAEEAEDARDRGAKIHLADSDALDRCLRGQTLSDERSERLGAVRPGDGEVALAIRDGAPMWVAGTGAGLWRHRCAALPRELEAGEVLRDRFRAGRFLALLPLLAMLRDLTMQSRWTPPPPRATFMFDDPNLHWTSYGYLDFADLATRAERGGFHVAFATVPLDAWYANRRAVALLRKAQLSLLIHGNNHSWCELGRVTAERAGLALTAQALARVRAFEARSGLAVARTMAPPHGRCSPAVFQALRRTGFHAACISRPHPWLERPPADSPLAQWGIADVVDGLPVLPRYSLAKSREDLPLRAFLGQPLILYGHHRDLSSGPQLLEEIAAEVNRMGEVRWQGMTTIARGSFLAKQDGESLKLRMYTQEAHVEVPAAVTRIAVEPPPGGEHPAVTSALVRSATRTATTRLRESVQLADGERSVVVRLLSADAVDPASLRVPRCPPWPRVRRLLTEGRDRLAPSVEPLGRLHAMRPGGR